MVIRAALPSLVIAATLACGNRPPTPSPPASGIPAPTAAASEGPPTTTTTGSTGAAPRDTAPTRLESRSLALPGAEGPAFLDYIAYERGRSRIWIPVPSTGSVDLFDIGSGTFTRIDGFGVAEREVHGKKRTMGPSAAAAGDGVVYIGNRATSEVCPVDIKT